MSRCRTKPGLANCHSQQREQLCCSSCSNSSCPSVRRGMNVFRVMIDDKLMGKASFIFTSQLLTLVGAVVVTIETLTVGHAYHFSTKNRRC